MYLRRPRIHEAGFDTAVHQRAYQALRAIHPSISDFGTACPSNLSSVLTVT
jgi:hypothetical protein